MYSSKTPDKVSDASEKKKNGYITVWAVASGPQHESSAMAEGGGSEGEWVATAMHAALSHLVEVAAAS